VFEVLMKKTLAPGVWRYRLQAPLIAAKRRAGHFVIVRPTRDAERIPLTIVSADVEAGTVDIIFQVVGATTRTLAEVRTGDALADVLGPLGHPTPVENYGTTVMIGGGVGIAPLLPIAQAFRQAGNRVVTILGGRSRDFLILKAELSAVSERVLTTTDDGSDGVKGLVTDALKTLLEAGQVDFVLAVGPVPMMKAVADMTRPGRIKTLVSLNPLMLDGTGMCGVCRCQVAGQTRLACVEGPEFDGHEVDFDSLRRRLGMFTAEENLRRERGSGRHATES